jgi:hypothetical protein
MVLCQRMFPAVDPSERKNTGNVPQSEEVTVPNWIFPLAFVFTPLDAVDQTVATSLFVIAIRLYPTVVDGSPVTVPALSQAVQSPA